MRIARLSALLVFMSVAVWISACSENQTKPEVSFVVALPAGVQFEDERLSQGNYLVIVSRWRESRCKGTFVSEEYTHLGPDVYLNDDTMSLTVDGVCSKLDEQVDSMQIDVIQSKSPSSIVVSFISPNHADATGLRVEFSFVVRE